MSKIKKKVKTKEADKDFKPNEKYYSKQGGKKVEEVKKDAKARILATRIKAAEKAKAEAEAKRKKESREAPVPIDNISDGIVTPSGRPANVVPLRPREKSEKIIADKTGRERRNHSTAGAKSGKPLKPQKNKFVKRCVNCGEDLTRTNQFGDIVQAEQGGAMNIRNKKCPHCKQSTEIPTPATLKREEEAQRAATAKLPKEKTVQEQQAEWEKYQIEHGMKPAPVDTPVVKPIEAKPATDMRRTKKKPKYKPAPGQTAFNLEEEKKAWTEYETKKAIGSSQRVKGKPEINETSGGLTGDVKNIVGGVGNMVRGGIQLARNRKGIVPGLKNTTAGKIAGGVKRAVMGTPTAPATQPAPQPQPIQTKDVGIEGLTHANSTIDGAWDKYKMDKTIEEKDKYIGDPNEDDSKPTETTKGKSSMERGECVHCGAEYQKGFDATCWRCGKSVSEDSVGKSIKNMVRMYGEPAEPLPETKSPPPIFYKTTGPVKKEGKT